MATSVAEADTSPDAGGPTPLPPGPQRPQHVRAPHASHPSVPAPCFQPPAALPSVPPLRVGVPGLASTSTAVLTSELATGSSGAWSRFARAGLFDFSGTWAGIHLMIKPRASVLQSIASTVGGLESNVPAVRARLLAQRQTRGLRRRGSHLTGTHDRRSWFQP